MATYNKFRSMVEYMAEKTFDFGADTLKVMLTNTAPVNTNTVFADLVEISSGNGYSAGGTAITITASSQTTGTYKLVGNDVVYTASGAVGPFRYAVFYDDTPTSPADPLVGWWDYGSSISLANGETFTVDLDQSGGIFTLA